jgi:YHS domain-containing protein
MIRLSHSSSERPMPTRRSTLSMIVSLCVMASLPLVATLAQDKPPAIDGYDPVAYFTEKKPVQGKAEFSQVFDDKRYLFSSAKHRDLFAANPERYEPQFNGLCAGNVAKGNKVKAIPTIWRVVDGKLFLFAGPQHDEAEVAKKVTLAQSKWKEIK